MTCTQKPDKTNNTAWIENVSSFEWVVLGFIEKLWKQEKSLFHSRIHFLKMGQAMQ